MKKEIDNNSMWAAFRQELVLQGELQVVAAIDNALNNLGFTIEETSTIIPIPLKQGDKDEEILILKDKIESLHAAINAIKETHRIELEKQGEQKPVIEMKTPEESLGIDSDTYNKIVDECIYGEQKHVDKIEPKFHEGEWTVSNLDGKARQISEVHFDEHNNYYVVNGMPVNLEEYDRRHRLWSIKDAKDGDVLACPNDAGDRDVVFIFKNINSDEGWVFCFCASDANGYFCTNNDYVGNLNNTNISPATKEQRDLLFQKMANAGYTFDFEKKELKKIEQKPAWSEEDESYLNTTIVYLKDAKEFKKTAENCINWLKSLKPQNRWKPSDEQMSALSDINCTGCISYAGQGQELINLYNDLKKLKG